MKNLIAILLLLLAYSFFYAGISHFWHGVTAAPTSSASTD